MVNQLIVAILLTIAPISELRGGMPIAIDYALKNNFPLIPIIILIILINILVIFVIFWFLDRFHEGFMRFKTYKRFYEAYLRRMQKKVDRFEKRYSAYGMLALALFVAIPFPTTGAWTGTIIAWLLGLDRKQSIGAITIGVIISGTIMALASLGIIHLFNSV